MENRKSIDYETIYIRLENQYKKYKNYDTACALMHAYQAIEGCALAGLLEQSDWLSFADNHCYYYTAARMRYEERRRFSHSL